MGIQMNRMLKTKILKNCHNYSPEFMQYTMNMMKTIDQVHHRLFDEQTSGNDRISGVNVPIFGDAI
jgi:hypothetical protein